MYIVLGGDTDIVPHRLCYCEAAEYEVYIACDLYYSDLDGSWDANNNNIFGEVDDNVDMYADVLVGRIPVSTPQEASIYLNKVIQYEKTPPPNYPLKIFLMGFDLRKDFWWPVYGEDTKVYIDYFWIPDRFMVAYEYDSESGTPESELSDSEAGMGITEYGS